MGNAGVRTQPGAAISAGMPGELLHADKGQLRAHDDNGDDDYDDVLWQEQVGSA